MRQPWQVVDGEVRVAVDEAEWLGASLAVLVAAIHHPDVLTACQPETEPSEVARAVLAELCELYAAASMADAQLQEIRVADPPGGEPVRRDGDEMVFSPGGELANLAMCLEVFATAVLKPASSEASVARGATAYAASAWSAAIGKASGKLGSERSGNGDPRQQSATPTNRPRAIQRGTSGP